jgi:uncharacterized protein
MNPVMHFEIHASRPDEAAKFYSSVFGWQVKKWEGPFDYWLVYTKSEKGNGIDGAIVARQGAPPASGAAANAYVCTIVVDALDTSMADVRKAGGTVTSERQEIPGIGWIADANDPDGNRFRMLEPNM